MEAPAALGSLFQPLSWLLVYFLAKVCGARHPGPSSEISGNPEGPFSPQKPFGAWGSGSETVFLQQELPRWQTGATVSSSSRACGMRAGRCPTFISRPWPSGALFIPSISCSLAEVGV